MFPSRWSDITNQFYQAFSYLFQQAGGILNTNEHQFSSDNLVVYPNPSNDNFLINFSGQSKELYFITDIAGKVIRLDYLHYGINVISLENELSGVYFLKVGANYFKLLKQH